MEGDEGAEKLEEIWGNAGGLEFFGACQVNFLARVEGAVAEFADLVGGGVRRKVIFGGLVAVVVVAVILGELVSQGAVGTELGGFVDTLKIAKLKCGAVTRADVFVINIAAPIVVGAESGSFEVGDDCTVVDAFVDQPVAIVVDAVHGEEEGVAVVVDEAVAGQDDIGDVDIVTVNGMGELAINIALRRASKKIPDLGRTRWAALWQHEGTVFECANSFVG